MEPLARYAVEAHRDAVALTERAAARRAQRDDAIRGLHRTGEWSYRRIAGLLGLSEEAIARIVRDAR